MYSASAYSGADRDYFREVKIAVSPRDELERRGFVFGSDGRIPCPIHGGEDDPNFTVYQPEDRPWKRYKCHSHGCSGTSIDLVINLDGLLDNKPGKREAMLFLAEAHKDKVSIETRGAHFYAKETKRAERIERVLRNPDAVEALADEIYDSLCREIVEAMDTSTEDAASYSLTKYVVLQELCEAAATEDLASDLDKLESSAAKASIEAGGAA